MSVRDLTGVRFPACRLSEVAQHGNEMRFRHHNPSSSEVFKKKNKHPSRVFPATIKQRWQVSLWGVPSILGGVALWA